MRTDLAKAIHSISRLCVGLDPSRHQLERWGLSPDLVGLKAFADLSLEQVIGKASIVKPQVAFFEQFGAAGFQVLQELISELRRADVFVIADAKRGDIGSTMAGYMRAWLTGGGFDANALTVHSFLGMDVIPDAASGSGIDSDRGFFALCATSNPEGASIQQSRTHEQPLARYIFDEAERISANQDYTVGVVIGATLDLELFGLGDLRTRKSEIPILAPGFGAQGAKLSELETTFGESASMVLPSLSRELMGDNPDGFGIRILDAAEQLR